MGNSSAKTSESSSSDDDRLKPLPTSILQNQLFLTVFLGGRLEKVEQAIEQLKQKEFVEKNKVFKLSSLRDSTTRLNLLQAACCYHYLHIDNKSEFIIKYLHDQHPEDFSEMLNQQDELRHRTCLHYLLNFVSPSAKISLPPTANVGVRLEIASPIEETLNALKGTPNGDERIESYRQFRSRKVRENCKKTADLVEFFLASGANPALQDRLKQTCLHLAASCCYTKVVVELVSHAKGRELTRSLNSFGRPPLVSAVKGGSIGCIEAIIPHLTQEEKDFGLENKSKSIHRPYRGILSIAAAVAVQRRQRNANISNNNNRHDFLNGVDEEDDNEREHDELEKYAAICEYLIKNKCDWTTEYFDIVFSTVHGADYMADGHTGKLRRRSQETSWGIQDQLSILFAAPPGNPSEMFSSSSQLWSAKGDHNQEVVLSEFFGKTGNPLIDACLVMNLRLFEIFLEQGTHDPFAGCSKLPNWMSAVEIIESYDPEKYGVIATVFKEMIDKHKKIVA